MYLVGKAGGFEAQEKLWTYLETGLVSLHEPEPREWRHLRRLMRQYKDAPMDLADASLVAAAERVRQRRIFTIDHHFYVYRLHGKDAFEVIP